MWCRGGFLPLTAGHHHRRPRQLESAGHLLIPWIKSTVEARAAADPGPGSNEQQGRTTPPTGAGSPIPCTCRQWWERFLEKRSQPNTQYPGKDGKSESQGLAKSILPREPNSPNGTRDPRTRSQSRQWIASCVPLEFKSYVSQCQYPEPERQQSAHFGHG